MKFVNIFITQFVILTINNNIYFLFHALLIQIFINRNTNSAQQYIEFYCN